jgi:hypothetical protein
MVVGNFDIERVTILEPEAQPSPRFPADEAPCTAQK